MPYWITRCYLPPGRADIPTHTPAKAAVLGLATPEGCKAELTYQTCQYVPKSFSFRGGGGGIWVLCMNIVNRTLRDRVISSGEKVFNKILTCPNHILRTLLPPPTARKYSLRNRPHNRQLPDRISRITDCNFTVRMLYRNMY